MRSFNNLDALWNSTLVELLQDEVPQTSRDGDVSAEIVGYSAELRYPLNNILLNPIRKFSLSYACAEVLWYLSGKANIKLIQAYAPQYERFAEDGIAYGAYGMRWSSNPGWVQESQFQGFKNQIDAVLNLLDAKSDSRQAVVAMWDSGDLIHAILGDHKDLPCTLSLQFLERKGYLHCIATMRSNDVWLGLPYDVFAFTTLQALMAQELDLGLGRYYHQAGSEHLYKRSGDKAKEAVLHVHEGQCYPGSMYPEYENHPVFKHLEMALAIEEQIRVKQSFDMTNPYLAELHPMVRDLVLGAASKWIAFPPSMFTNPIYRLVAERAYREAGYRTGTC